MKYYVIDAFADRLFRGNPAGVCLPERKLSASEMQRIASENNLAETAFLFQENGSYQLRWFTPELEIDLCGHATLATAYVLMNFVDETLTEVSFETQSGVLGVTRLRDVYTLDFPARKPVEIPRPFGLEQALGSPCKILGTWQSRDLLVLLETEEDVKNVRPNMDLLKAASPSAASGVIVTAKGIRYDFVSRFFAPGAGVAEDPVTGSAHSTLIPFWGERLKKDVMTAKQVSRRSGILYCENCGSRVKIGGTAVCYMAGELNV